MRSLISKIFTGLWIRDWRAAYELAQYHTRLAAGDSAFACLVPAHLTTPHEWIKAVIEEAKFRMCIASMRGRDLSMRAAIRQVIDEVTRPGKPAENPGTVADKRLITGRNIEEYQRRG